MADCILQVQDLTKRYGGLVAVNDVSFHLREQEILSVIGPNGAGKSTLFKLISSFLRPTSGEVLFKGERISGLAPHIVARKGVVRTFQETTIFKGMSVRDNVIIAHHLRSQARACSASSSAPAWPRPTRRRSPDRPTRSSSFLGLVALADEIAKNLPQGHLRALGIAIGLATNPTVLLLDEPFAGMNHEETMQAVDMVQAACANAA